MHSAEDQLLSAQQTPGEPNEATPLKKTSSLDKSSYWMSCLCFGPGLFVCLADTDAGCLIVAAQSGARWGYSLLLLQILLIPVLFFAQELTVRLGVWTKMGHAACIKQHFGSFWGWFTTSLLIIECTLATISEMSGFAGVAELWGLSRTLGTVLASALVVLVVFFCNYRQIETIGIVLGLFELTFVVSMFLLHPSPSDVLKGTFTFHADSEYLKLVAANIGAVIMPWMIYFQQSAIVARRLTTKEDIAVEQKQTLFGSVLTQLVMIGTLVTLAAAPRASQDLESVMQIQFALAPSLSTTGAKVIITCAFVGGSLCATFVVALAASWAVCEVRGWDDAFSLDRSPLEAPHFYGCFLSVVVLGALVLLSGVDIVQLNVYVELMDGLLMPFAVGFLFLLATSDLLPEEVRVKGAYKYMLGTIFSICGVISFCTGIYGLVKDAYGELN